jgi:hypothetical protein
MFTKQDQQILSERYYQVREMNISPLAGQGTLGGPIVMAVKTPPVDEPDENEEHDHSEIEMAASELYKLAEYTPKLLEMVKEMPSLEGWVASKITKASDYISSVYHWLDYQQHGTGEEEGCGCGSDDHGIGMYNKGHEDISHIVEI